MIGLKMMMMQVVTRRIGCSSLGAGLAVTVIVNSLLLLAFVTTAGDCHRHQQSLIKVNPNRYTPPQQHINPALFLHPSEEIDLLLHYADDDGHDIISSGSDYEGEEEEGEELYIDADFDAAFDWHWRNHDVLHANGGPPHAAVALNHDYNHPHHHLPRHRQHPDQHRHPHHYSSSSSSSSWPNVPLFYGDLLKSSHFRRGRAVRDYLRATTRQRPQPRQQPRQQHRQQQHYHQLAALGGGGHNSSPILFIAVRE